MGRPRGWATERTGRPPMRSPGRPSVNQREARQAFWEHIAAGLSSEDAALASSVSQLVGTRWFREAGGVPQGSLGPHSGRYLSFTEREEIALLRALRCGVREIARQLGRSPSTVSRELRRNAATRGGRAVIPRKRNSIKGNTNLDRGLYRCQHLVENAFARLKHYRAALRYDKLKRNYESMIAMACGFLWPPCESSTGPSENAQAS